MSAALLLQTLAGAAAATIHDAIGAARTNADLDDLIKLVWRGNLDGAIDDVDATHLHVYAAQRRNRFVSLQPVIAQGSIADRLPVAAPNLRRVESRGYHSQSRFPRRREQRSPDKPASYERRHRLAYSGILPRHLAPRLTIADMAVMRVIADEYVRGAGCNLSLAEIAARAGVCRKTAKRATQKAKDQRLISIEERPVRRQRHKPNLIRIISFEWLKWLRRSKTDAARASNGPSEGPERSVKAAGGGGHLVPPTDTTLVDDDGGGVVEFNKTEPPPETAPPQGGRPTKKAHEFADELALIAGYKPDTTPDSWRNANPPQVIQAWLNELDKFDKAALYPCRTPVELLRSFAQHVMERKRASDPSLPHSPRYFGAEVQKFIGRTERVTRKILEWRDQSMKRPGPQPGRGPRRRVA
jgi:hypothetical protein